MEKISGNEKQQNPFNEEQQVEVVVKTPIVHLIPEDPEVLKTNIKNLQREIALGLKEKKKFDASVRDYGNITLNDLPFDEQAVINSLPGKQEKLAVYKEVYEKRKVKKLPILKKIRKVVKEAMKTAAGIFPSF
jgi:hypothetical protein